MKILIVEDQLETRLLLNNLLSNWGYETLLADNGAEAIKILNENDISIVISDWIMPEVSGPELLQHLRNSGGSYRYFIMLTTKDNRDDVSFALSKGADDFITKPFNKEELRSRIAAGKRIITLQNELVQKNERLTEYSDEFNKDLQIAKDLQLNLMPEDKLEAGGVTFEHFFRSSKFLSGDLSDYYKLDESKSLFYVLDVTGHGIASAMKAFNIKSKIDEHVKNIYKSNEGFNPSSVLKSLNSEFASTNDIDYSFSLLMGIIDTETKEVLLSNSGLPYPVKRGEENQLVEISGVPLGLIDNDTYKDVTLTLSRGDILYLYSDGLLGNENKAYSELLCNITGGNEELRSFLNNIDTDEYEDDISILKIEYFTG